MKTATDTYDNLISSITSPASIAGAVAPPGNYIKRMTEAARLTIPFPVLAGTLPFSTTTTTNAARRSAKPGPRCHGQALRLKMAMAMAREFAKLHASPRSFHLPEAIIPGLCRAKAEARHSSKTRAEAGVTSKKRSPS